MPPLSGRRNQSQQEGDTGAQVAAGQVAAPVQPQQRQQGPGWVDFGRLLSANRAGAQRMADNLIAGVRQEGDAANSGIQQGVDTYGKSLQANTTQYNPNSVTTADEAIAKSGGSFQGPKSWTDAGINTAELAGKAASAEGKAKNLTSDYGRAALLRAQAKGPYTAGMSGLDAALAGAAGGAALQDTANAYGNLSQRLIDAQVGAGAQYDAAVKADSEARGKYKTRADEIRAGIAAEQQAARDAQQEREATDAAGPTADGDPGGYGSNARNVAEEKRRRAKPGAPSTAGGTRGGVGEAEGRRIGGIVHRNLGGWL